jgi:hypothetical protein
MKIQLLLVTGVIAALGFAGGYGASAASATKAPATITATWATTSDPTRPLPTDASNVAWPQTLLSPAPACLPRATVVQVDVYSYDAAHKADVDALLAHGVLNKPGSANWTDSAFVISWSYRVIPACQITTTSASVSPTPTESTPPSITAALSCMAADVTVTNTGAHDVLVDIQDVPVGGVGVLPTTRLTVKAGEHVTTHFPLASSVYLTGTDLVSVTVYDGATALAHKSFPVSRVCTGTTATSSAAPSPSASAPSAPPVSQPVAVAPVAASSTDEPGLAFTGPHTGAIFGVGLAVLALGIVITAASKRHRY